MTRFAGRNAVVTGASSGVGRAVALALASHGAKVAAFGRRTSSIDETVTLVRERGGQAIPVIVDVSSAVEVERAASTVRKEMGPVDFMVNAAGVLHLGPVPSMSEAQWDELFATNVKSLFLLARAFIPEMSAGRGGAIVNISSVFALAAGKGSAAYAASKAAVLALTRTMALDHIEAGVRINCIAPGAMATEMLSAVAEAAAPHNPQSALDAMGHLNPIRRLIAPEEVADLTLYLLSDAAAAIVGSTLTIDGGRLAKLGNAD